MTSKNTAAKKPAQPRKARKTAPAKPAAEKADVIENVVLMKAFHQGDAIARTLYPVQPWNAEKEVNALRTALITAMNLYNVGYVSSQAKLRDLASEKLTQVAVKHTLGEMPEDVLVTLNGETLAVADALGMPLTPRAPFARGHQDVIGLAQGVRQSYAHLERPLTMNDLQTYYYTTNFSMSPVAYFVTATEDYASLFKTLLSACGSSAFLQFSPRGVQLLQSTDPTIVTNTMWLMGIHTLAALDKLLDGFAGADDVNPTVKAFIENNRDVTEQDVGFTQLIDYVMGHVRSLA